MRASSFLLLATGVSGMANNSVVTLSNGVSMPLAAMGVWQYKSDEARDAIKLALQAGFTHIDTANE
jgi:diketogulonate reductase-like aldo/keto reductase